MSEGITLHDALDFVLTFDGVTFQGFGDGDAIGLEAPSEVVKAKVGAFGEVAVSTIRNKLYGLKVNLHQTSTMNSTLRAMFNAQWSDTTKTLRTLSLKRKSTGEVWRGIAFIAQDAGLKVGAEVQNLEWSFGFILDTPGAAA